MPDTKPLNMLQLKIVTNTPFALLVKHLFHAMFVLQNRHRAMENIGDFTISQFLTPCRRIISDWQTRFATSNTCIQLGQGNPTDTYRRTDAHRQTTLLFFSF